MIVDTNIVIDLVAGGADAEADRIMRTFARLTAVRPASINHIIYAETVPRMQSQESLDGQLARLRLSVIALSENEAWRAGVAFRDYRRNGGPRVAILPDFLIGAQASLRGMPILTRDRARFATYFPEVELIDPLVEAQ